MGKSEKPAAAGGDEETGGADMLKNPMDALDDEGNE
jgi:hypothetical protein